MVEHKGTEVDSEVGDGAARYRYREYTSDTDSGPTIASEARGAYHPNRAPPDTRPAPPGPGRHPPDQRATTLAHART